MFQEALQRFATCSTSPKHRRTNNKQEKLQRKIKHSKKHQTKPGTYQISPSASLEQQVDLLGFIVLFSLEKLVNKNGRRLTTEGAGSFEQKAKTSCNGLKPFQQDQQNDLSIGIVFPQNGLEEELGFGFAKKNPRKTHNKSPQKALQPCWSSNPKSNQFFSSQSQEFWAHWLHSSQHKKKGDGRWGR